MVKPKTRLTATEALDRICRRELGLPYARCSTGGATSEAVIAALEELLSAISKPQTDELQLVSEKDVMDADDAIARMAETGLLHPVQFLPETSKSGLRTVIRVAAEEYRLMPSASYRLRGIPDKLQRRALGLAALVRHALRH
jgi:hypothetical protein